MFSTSGSGIAFVDKPILVLVLLLPQSSFPPQPQLALDGRIAENLQLLRMNSIRPPEIRRIRRVRSVPPDKTSPQQCLREAPT